MKFKYVIAGTTLAKEISIRGAKDESSLEKWLKSIEQLLDQDVAKIMSQLKNKNSVQFTTKDNKYSWTVAANDKVQLLSY